MLNTSKDPVFCLFLSPNSLSSAFAHESSSSSSFPFPFFHFLQFPTTMVVGPSK